MLTCLQCKAKISLDAERCAACGTKIDADGDGVPDALDRMVEDKARSLLKTEKQREENEREREARYERDAEREKHRRTNEQQLASLKKKQKADEKVPRSAWRMSKGVLLLLSVCAFLVGGIAFPACVEPLAGRSVAAGSLFCASVCDTCRGPGRIFTWVRSSGGRSQSNESMQLCHNDAMDIDQMSWMAADDPPTEPYRLTLWTSVPVDFGIVFAFLLLVGPFLTARLRNAWLDHERLAREKQIRVLTAAIGYATPKEPKEPYR